MYSYLLQTSNLCKLLSLQLDKNILFLLTRLLYKIFPPAFSLFLQLLPNHRVCPHLFFVSFFCFLCGCLEIQDIFNDHTNISSRLKKIKKFQSSSLCSIIFPITCLNITQKHSTSHIVILTSSHSLFSQFTRFLCLFFASSQFPLLP